MRAVKVAISATFLIASAAGSFAQPPDALDQARARACRLDGREFIISAVQHGDEDGPGGVQKLILENAKSEGCLIRYRNFANSSHAALLRRYANRHDRSEGGYTAQTCGVLLPYYAAVETAEKIAGAGARLSPGVVLTKCGGGYCAPAEVQHIAEKCSFDFMQVPPESICSN
jgi:hypothetical protein